MNISSKSMVCLKQDSGLGWIFPIRELVCILHYSKFSITASLFLHFPVNVQKQNYFLCECPDYLFCCTLCTRTIFRCFVFVRCPPPPARQSYTAAGNARRRGRQRIPRGALEARLQLHHPGIELGRLRLLLVDRDFTGEGEFSK